MMSKYDNQNICIKDKYKHLKTISKEIRKDILISLCQAGSGHLGGSLGLADIFTALYFEVLNHKPDQPNFEKRDKLILSIGHVTPVLYATLAHSGYFEKEKLMHLRKFGSQLQGHPCLSVNLPGIETSSGSLGQGLSIAVGMAIADKIDNINRRIFCICGDGEIQEGQIWEAMMSAAHYKLSNIKLIIDRNNLQIDGSTSEVMELEPLTDKLKSFGWEVAECDGNNFDELLPALKLQTSKPLAIIAKTFMGKGVPKIENNNSWHGKVPNKEELEQFLKELY